MAGKLYIVPTPVGNLDDMTPRAIAVLRDAHLVLAEDTRTSGVLMKHFGITTPMRSHHKFNEHDTLPALVEELQGGSIIALVTDAGTPAISDPGFLLVRECRRCGRWGRIRCREHGDTPGASPLPGAAACRGVDGALRSRSDLSPRNHLSPLGPIADVPARVRTAEH